jgi:hypothetical protein
MAAPPEDKRPPMAIAMEWVSQVTTVVLEMVLPGLGGQWLDGKLDTGYLGLLGFAFGVTLGVWHLIWMTRPRNQSPRRSDGSGPEGGHSGNGSGA